MTVRSFSSLNEPRSSPGINTPRCRGQGLGISFLHLLGERLFTRNGPRNSGRGGESIIRAVNYDNLIFVSFSIIIERFPGNTTPKRAEYAAGTSARDRNSRII